MVTQQWSDEIIIVNLQNDPEFTDELNILAENMAREAKNIVLSFGNIKYLNSSNISRLLKLRKTIIDANRQLKLCEIPIQVWGVFLLMGLDSIFDVAEDIASALTSLQMN